MNSRDDLPSTTKRGQEVLHEGLASPYAGRGGGPLLPYTPPALLPQLMSPSSPAASPPSPGGSVVSGGKRARTGEASGPQRTLYVRNIPVDCSEADLLQLAGPFGPVVNVTLLRGKGQGFVQLQDPGSAARMLQHYTTNVPYIRGRPCYWQYSNRDTVAAPVGPPLESPSSVLLLTFFNLIYPVALDTLHVLFSRFGRVAKIVTFNKHHGFQAFVQYEDIRAAMEARAQLDGQNMYPGCNTVRLQYSQMTGQLNVKFNSDRQRDYSSETLLSPLHAAPSLFPPPSMALVGHPGPAAPAVLGYGASLPAPALTMGLSAMSLGVPVSPTSVHGGPPRLPTDTGLPGSCVILSGLTEACGPDELFNLFGQYGDVVRVKILHNKRDTALIQLGTPSQAAISIAHLNGCPLLGQLLHVSLSRLSFITLTRNDLDTPALSRDYTGSPHHRFRNPTSKNFAHIIAPSSLLHVMGVPDDITEEAVRELFAPHGKVHAVRIFQPKERKMVLVHLGSVSEAVEALVKLNLSKYCDGLLRVSFSKVCRRWRSLTSDDRLWTKIFAHSFGQKAFKKIEREIMFKPHMSGGPIWRDIFFKRMQQTVLRCQITFAIRYNTIPGQIIAVMGNVEALGGWDVRKAHRMEYLHTPNETEPNWKLTLSIPVGLLRHSLRLEYKYVLVNDDMTPLRAEGTSRRKEIFRGESVYYFRNYWNRVGFEFCSGYRHQYWENQRWSIDINTCRKVVTTSGS